MFRIAQYVRHASTDHGTGQIVEIRMRQSLQGDGTIANAVTYLVKWLDLGGGRLLPHAGDELVASMRDVPKFSSPEEAEEWMEAQREGGQWVNTAEDFNARVADVMQAHAAQVAVEAEQAFKAACGTLECGCQDCVSYTDTSGFQHVPAHGCECQQRGCGCVRP